MNSVLTEDVQLVRRLKGNYQITDWGRIGRFRVFSAAKPTEDNQRLRRQEKIADPDLHKIYKLADYKRVRNRIETYIDWVIEKENEVRKTLLQASRVLAWLGFRPMDVTLVFRNLEHAQNQITVGGVGGQYQRTKHGIEINSADFLQGNAAWRQEIVIHEYAHAYWGTVLPKDSKNAFADYYWEHVVGPVVDVVISGEALDTSVKIAWDSVQDRVRAVLGGLDIDGYMALYRKYAGPLNKTVDKNDKTEYEQLQKQLRRDITDTTLRGKGHTLFTATVKEPFGDYQKGDRVQVLKSGDAKGGLSIHILPLPE